MDNLETFFYHKSIFITGASGFIGKILVEKLLRSFPDIDTIYLLIRDKGDKNVASRLQKIVDCELFSPLKNQRPEALQKLKVISGDITQNGLGISESDRQELIERVNIVFHSAATVKFDEPLKLAININLQGTKRMVELCRSLKHLQVLVYVSTAYSNCNRSEVGEVIYPSTWDVEKIIEETCSMSDELIAKRTPQIMGDWPNTYTFTKALAEQVVADASKYLPITIVRPSILVATAKDPFPGWIENRNGPVGVISGASMGINNSFFFDQRTVVDLIPADVVIATIICSAWALACKKTNNLTIYNCCASSHKQVTWGEYLSLCMFYIHKYPLEKILWYPRAHCYTNRTLYDMSFIFRDILPVYLVDTANVLMKRKNKPRLVPVCRKISKTLIVVNYFLTHQWHFKNNNFLSLSNLLSAEDNEKFSMDISNICWSSELEKYVLGIRRHIFGQSDSTIPRARKTLKWFKWAHYIIKFSSIALVIFISILFIENAILH